MQSSPIDIRDRTPYDTNQFCVKDEYRADLQSLLLSEGEIECRIECLAAEISRRYRTSDVPFYSLCVLKGAMRFFGALTPQLEPAGPSSEGTVRASRYSEGKGAGYTDVQFLDPEAIEGKDILFVEDIIDEGFTLQAILEEVERFNPNSVEIAVLFDKHDRRKADIDVAFTGFVIPDEFVVGYGLDYDEGYRNLRHLAVLDDDAR
jgi:hypoxanthine phosphoribosyltransferase